MNGHNKAQGGDGSGSGSRHVGPVQRFAEWLRNRVTQGNTNERSEAWERAQREINDHKRRLKNIQHRQAIITGERRK
jgi:hypothetical protein